mmetsp:Transcript_15401/g.39676  ORF Transcript_15401/g.39676 Transcript_15401/m.39676 type:complete len:225 (-) Transcript_15401:289-963(-)
MRVACTGSLCSDWSMRRLRRRASSCATGLSQASLQSTCASPAPSTPQARASRAAARAVVSRRRCSDASCAREGPPLWWDCRSGCVTSWLCSSRPRAAQHVRSAFSHPSRAMAPRGRARPSLLARPRLLTTGVSMRRIWGRICPLGRHLTGRCTTTMKTTIAEMRKTWTLTKTMKTTKTKTMKTTKKTTTMKMKMKTMKTKTMKTTRRTATRLTTMSTREVMMRA